MRLTNAVIAGSSSTTRSVPQSTSVGVTCVLAHLKPRPASSRLTRLRHRSRQKRLGYALSTFSYGPRALNSGLFEQRQRSLRYTTALSAPFHGASAADERPPL